MVGNFKQSGAKWDRAPVLVNDHDFLSDAEGVGLSYGIYDPVLNRGMVSVGISHDTSAFAAHSIATWWKREGSEHYAGASRLLILADAGGSNSYNRWAWKTQVQTQVCNPFSLTVTVAHYPTVRPNGTLLNIAYSRRSVRTGRRPLVSYEKMLNFIRTTKTMTGLVVTANLDRANYPTGIKPDPEEISSVRLKRGKILPRWNYTIAPNQ